MNAKNRVLWPLVGLLMYGLVASQAQATPVSVSDTQLQTVTGQLFNFSFGSLPNPGTGGLFELTIRGDYSGFGSETAIAKIDIAGGILDVGNTTNGVVTNTIAGLALISSSKTTFSFNDVLYDFNFSMTDALLNLAIADGTFTSSVDLDPGVNNFANTSFTKVALSYQTVPEPATLALLGLGLAGLGFRAKRKKLN